VLNSIILTTGETVKEFERKFLKYLGCKYKMALLGWKYNMVNIRAALLLHQLENTEKYWERHEGICRMYKEAFKGEPQVSCLKVLPTQKVPGTCSQFWSLRKSMTPFCGNFRKRGQGWRSIMGQSIC